MTRADLDFYLSCHSRFFSRSVEQKLCLEYNSVELYHKIHYYIYLHKLSFLRKSISRLVRHREHFIILHDKKCCQMSLLFGTDEYGYGWNMMGMGYGGSHNDKVPDKMHVVLIYLCIQELKKRYKTESQFFSSYRNETLSGLLIRFGICSNRISLALCNSIFDSFLCRTIDDHRLITLELMYPNCLVSCFFMFYMYDIHDYWRSRISGILMNEWNPSKHDPYLLEYLYQNRKKSISKSAYESIQYMESQYLSLEKRKQILDYLPNPRMSTTYNHSSSSYPVKKWKSSMIDLYNILLKFYFHFYPHHDKTDFSRFINKKRELSSCCEFNKWLDYLYIHVLSYNIHMTLCMYGIPNENYDFDPVFSFLLRKHIEKHASHTSLSNSQILWNQNMYDWMDLFPRSSFDKEYIKEFIVLFMPFLVQKKRRVMSTSRHCRYLDESSRRIWCSIEWKKSNIDFISLFCLLKQWSRVHGTLSQYLEKKKRIVKSLKTLCIIYRRIMCFYGIPGWNDDDRCVIDIHDVGRLGKLVLYDLIGMSEKGR